jgi:hypothetical protein
MDPYRLDLICDDDPDTPLEIAYFEALNTESALMKADQQFAEMASANAGQAAGELSGDLWLNAGGHLVYVTTILAPDHDLEVSNHG